jgi:uncharacterized membrane protein
VTRFLLWLLGAKALPAGRPESVVLDFVSLRAGYAGPVLATALLAAVALAFWVYRKRRESLGRVRWVLMALRVIPILLLVFLLSGPVLEVRGKSTTRSALVFLLDNSQSMTLADLADEQSAPERRREVGVALGFSDLKKPTKDISPKQAKRIAEATRMDIMKHVLHGDGNALVPELGGPYDLKFYTFGRSVRSGKAAISRYADWIDGVRCDETETGLGTALHGVLNDLRGKPLAGVVVLTDGSVNAGPDPGEACALAARRGIPVYFVGIGNDAVRDVQVSFIDMRDVIFLEDQVAVTVRLKHSGCAGKTVRLVVSQEKRDLAREDVVLAQSGEQIEVIRFTPDRKGTHTFTVRAEPIEHELVSLNNQKSRQCRVIDQKIRILWLETGPRWEYRFARNMIKRDKKRFECQILQYEMDQNLAEQSDVYISEFPKTREEVMRQHVIVLGDIDANRLSKEQMLWIKEFVAEKGGALVFLPGRVFSPVVWSGGPLAEVLPVVPTAGERRREALDDVNHPITHGQFARVTPAGREHPLMFVSKDERTSMEAWNRHLRVFTQYPIDRAKPGAQVLLEARDEAATPLIVAGVHGAGSVLYVGTDDLWRWRYRPGPLTHDRFWGSLLQQMALASLLGHSRKINLTLSRPELAPGEQQTIGVQLLAATEDELQAQTLDVSIRFRDEDGNETTETLALRTETAGTGLFTGKTVPKKAGSFTVLVRHGEEEVSRSFMALEPQVEFDNPALDRESLRKWAKLSGGNVYDPWALDALPGEIDVKAKSTSMEITDEMWDAPLWVFLFVALAGTEWFWRKWRNLP